MALLNGIYPAVPTPMSADGSSIALDRIKPVCDILFQDGVAGVFICGTTGEGPSLTAEEKLDLIQETVRAVDGRGQVIAQILCADQKGTLRVARIAPKMGITAISIMQPCFYGCDEEAQYQYLSRIAEAVNEFPLYLYNIPQCSGNDLPNPVLDRLLKKFPQIRGIKESGSYEKMQSWLPFQSEHFQVMSELTLKLCNLLREGGKAAVASTANFQAKHFVKLFEFANKQDWEQAQGVQRQINRLVEILDQRNIIAQIKEYYRMRGIDWRCASAPAQSPSGRIRELRKNLKELNLVE